MARVQLNDMAAVDLQGGEAIIFANCPDVLLVGGFKSDPVNLVLTNKRLVVVSNKDGNQLHSINYGEIKGLKGYNGDAETGGGKYIDITPQSGKVIKFIVVINKNVAKAAAASVGGGCLTAVPQILLSALIGGLTFGLVKPKFKSKSKVDNSAVVAANEASKGVVGPRDASWGKIPGGWESVVEQGKEIVQLHSGACEKRRDGIVALIQSCKGLA